MSFLQEQNPVRSVLCLLIACCIPLDAEAQTQRRRLAVDVGYGVYQTAVDFTDDFGEAEFLDIDEDVLPLTFGLNYRFTRRMSLYGDYTQSPFYTALEGGQAQFSAITLGIMPLSGFFEFGVGYSRFSQARFTGNKDAGSRRELSEETVHGANLRLRFDFKLFEGLSVYAGAQVYGMLPNDDRSTLNAIGHGNVGVQLYLIGKDKKYISRRERRKLRKLDRERDLERLKELKESRSQQQSQ